MPENLWGEPEPHLLDAPALRFLPLPRLTLRRGRHRRPMSVWRTACLTLVAAGAAAGLATAPGLAGPALAVAGVWAAGTAVAAVALEPVLEQDVPDAAPRHA